MPNSPHTTYRRHAHFMPAVWHASLQPRAGRNPKHYMSFVRREAKNKMVLGQEVSLGL